MTGSAVATALPPSESVIVAVMVWFVPRGSVPFANGVAPLPMTTTSPELLTKLNE